MNREKIVQLLADYNPQHVDRYATYCVRLSLEKDKNGKLKNFWILSKSEEQLAEYFRRIADEGLVLDGEHITLQSTGLSFDYIAYKNKMFLAYPESEVDINLVYKGDDFSFSKESGKVKYSHNIIDPFGQKDVDIVGGYCVIKNKRGEFLTLLNKDDIDKHRKVAKTDFIWAQWFKEMALKTVIKKAVKQHFADVYQEIDREDNENYDLSNPLELDIQYKSDIDAITTIDGLKKYYDENKGKGKDFDAYMTKRKQEIINQNQS